MASALRTKTNVQRSTAEANRRADKGMVMGKNSTAMMPTTVASKSGVGLDAEIRASVAATLIRFPNKSVETGGDLSNEGVRLLKAGRRTISTETLIKLARSGGALGPAMWAVICELCDRPAAERNEHESVRMNALFGALDMISRTKGPVGEFASTLIREMNAAEATPEKKPAAESADGYDPKGAIYNLFPEMPKPEHRRRA